MNWEKIEESILLSYPFFRNLNSKTQLTSGVHPFVLLNSYLCIKSIETSLPKKLLIILPFKADIAKWVSVVTTLKLLKEDSLANQDIKIEYLPGQKLLINGVVVEFVGEENNPSYGYRFIIRYWNDDKKHPGYITDHIPCENNQMFEMADQNCEISSYSKVVKALLGLEESSVVTNDILGINFRNTISRFERNVILVSGIGETKRFAEMNTVNNVLVSELFPWGKLDYTGDTTALFYKEKAKPNCIISSNMFGIEEYISKKGKNYGIIIDGIDKCTDNLQQLDDLIDSGNRIVVFCDRNELDEANKYLINRDFLVWSWDKKMIAGLTSTLSIGDINKSFNTQLKNYSELGIKVLKSNNPIIEELINISSPVLKINPEDSGLINKFKFNLLSAINEIIRLGFIPDNEYLTSFLKKLEELKKEYGLISNMASNDTRVGLTKILDMLTNLKINDFAHPESKANKIISWFNNLSGDDKNKKYITIFDDLNPARLHQDHFANSIDKEIKLETIAFEDFIISHNFEEDAVIFTGWPGKKKMKIISNINAAKNMLFFLYPQEQKWFNSYIRNTEKYSFGKNELDKFAEYLDVPVIEELKTALTEYSDQTENIIGIDDITEAQDTLLISSYLPDDNECNNPIPSKLVVFNRDYFWYSTENHRFIVITDLIANCTDGQIKTSRPEGLHVGDTVLIRESNKDLIREIAEIDLKNRDEEWAIEKSKVWKDALKTEYKKQYENIFRLISVLREAGCNRQVQTIKLWLFEDDRIGLRDEKDLEYIAKATGSKEMINNLDKIREAIHLVRAAHLRAGDTLAKELLNRLPDVLNGTGNKIRSSIDLGEYGTAFLLKVIVVADDYIDIESIKVNKLLNKNKSNDQTHTSTVVFRK
ncbi:MAG: DrmE family protein [Candidatus Shapirobacteria bacterium]|nr:DrmE family protein [Candidatus Shapirobacteria bacterium]